MERPLKDDLVNKLDEIDLLIRERLAAAPDQPTRNTLLDIRQKQQELLNMVLAM